MGKGKISKKRARILRRFNDQLAWGVTKKYVEMLRGKGELLSIGAVDVDVPQIIRRRFICEGRCG